MSTATTAVPKTKVVVIHQDSLRISISVDNWPSVNDEITVPVAQSHRLIFNSPKLKKYLGKRVKLTGTCSGPASTASVDYRNFTFEEAE